MSFWQNEKVLLRGISVLLVVSRAGDQFESLSEFANESTVPFLHCEIGRIRAWIVKLGSIKKLSKYHARISLIATVCCTSRLSCCCPLFSPYWFSPQLFSRRFKIHCSNSFFLQPSMLKNQLWQSCFHANEESPWFSWRKNCSKSTDSGFKSLNHSTNYVFLNIFYQKLYQTYQFPTKNQSGTYSLTLFQHLGKEKERNLMEINLVDMFRLKFFRDNEELTRENINACLFKSWKEQI